MGNLLSSFEPVAGLDGIYTAERNTLRCTAIRLASGDLCLYSPVFGLSEVALASLNELGNVSHLLAPNHYHHKALREYCEALPSGQLCASTFAHARLIKQTGLDFDGLDELAAILPDGFSFIYPQGLKTGEVWVSIEGNQKPAWIVTDSFCGSKLPSGKFADQPSLLGTFPSFGIADLRLYRQWLKLVIEERPPAMIVPCHGSIINGPNVAAGAFKLVEELS